MTATIATHHLALARQARDAGRLADVISNATTAWGIAEAERDRITAWHSISCIGRAFLARDEADEALRWYEEAFGYAKAHALIPQMAGSAHDRYLSARSCGKMEEAHRAAGTAMDLYGYRGSRLSGLVADMSEEKVTSDPGFTFHAWKAFHSDATTARDRLYALANMTTAASYASERLFAEYWPTLRAFLSPEMERASILYVQAAEDGLRRNRVEDAHALAETGLRLAQERGEGQARERAERALDCATSARVPRP